MTVVKTIDRESLHNMAVNITSALDISSNVATAPVDTNAFTDVSDHNVQLWFTRHKPSIFKMLKITAQNRWTSRSVISMVLSRANEAHRTPIETPEKLDLDLVASIFMEPQYYQESNTDKGKIFHEIARLSAKIILEEVEKRVEEEWESGMPLVPAYGEVQIGVAINSDVI